MEFFLIIFVVFILIVAAVLLVALYYLRKGYRFIKRMTNGEMTEEDFERLSKKFQKAGGTTFKFDDDYFKGSGTQRQYPQSCKDARKCASAHTLSHGGPYACCNKPRSSLRHSLPASA